MFIYTRAPLRGPDAIPSDPSHRAISVIYPIMASNGATPPIIDIRTGPTEFDILQDIKQGLRPQDGGEKKLPTLLLYDEAGLRLFEKITYLDEYYLTNAEIEVNSRNSSTLLILLLPYRILCR